MPVPASDAVEDRQRLRRKRAVGPGADVEQVVPVACEVAIDAPQQVPVAVVVLVAAVATNHAYDLFPIYGAYPLLMLATARRFCLPDLKRFGDVSYGMYLYGWPVQQTFVALAGGVGAISWHALFAVSTLAAGVMGYASWHLLEKRALQWKSRLAGRRGRLVDLRAQGAKSQSSP